MITLASSSPRRKELIKKIFKEVEIVKPDVDEQVIEGESAIEMVKRLSTMKANSVKRDNIIIAADTTVEIDETILGKPLDEEDAFRMISMLSGRWHKVHTGVCIRYGSECISFVETTRVKFHDLDRETIVNYVKSGDPMDKAGGYGVQENMGMVLVERIEGDFFNVVGLPISRIWWELKGRKWI
ncbi:Maf family protein [Athalassotoga saccharophila]|uniref:Maf family protein n=1 Tax=Athalassotoga saccharophila TaxID=1441386 RepID=UPI0013797CCA|nr:Maf family protein [Athalassotoga saccharophila]BBJ28273.1 septum formation protein Maf [Athalassotoga saccharophila]